MFMSKCYPDDLLWEESLEGVNDCRWTSSTAIFFFRWINSFHVTSSNRVHLNIVGRHCANKSIVLQNKRVSVYNHSSQHTRNIKFSITSTIFQGRHSSSYAIIFKRLFWSIRNTFLHFSGLFLLISKTFLTESNITRVSTSKRRFKILIFLTFLFVFV